MRDYDFDLATYPIRTYCQVVDEMRKLISLLDHYNTQQTKSILQTLLEELQSIGNRMEAGLEYGNSIEELHAKRKIIIKEIKELKKEKKALEPKND